MRVQLVRVSEKLQSRLHTVRESRSDRLRADTLDMSHGSSSIRDAAFEARASWALSPIE